MKLLKIICLLLYLCFSVKTKGQQIDLFQFNKLSNKEYLPYKDEQGNFLGCGYTYECGKMKIDFYEINLNKKDGIIKIRGRILDPIDSSGVSMADILIAQPDGNKLTKARLLCTTYYRSPGDTSANKYPHQNGDFLIQSEFSSKDRLYFLDALFEPMEYYIGKLLY